VRIGLVTYGFSLYNMSVASYSCWSVFDISYNVPPALCMKYEYMFLCLIIPSPDHPRTNLNVMLKPLIKELKHRKELKHIIMTRRKNSNFELCICGQYIFLGRTVFFQDEVAMDFSHVRYV
jgi:hypothetical protein